MCFQRFQIFTGCGHLAVHDTPCAEAVDDPSWNKAECKNYNSETCEDSQDKCGKGRYYCSHHGADGLLLDSIHEDLQRGKAMIPWLRTRHDDAFNHLQNIRRAFAVARVPVQSQATNQIVIDAVREHRKKTVELARTLHSVKQCQRKVSSAESYYRFAVPLATQQRLALPALIIPSDEPWKQPAFDFRPSSAIFPIDEYPSIDAGDPQPYPPGMLQILQQFTPSDDLGDITGSAWLDNATLHTLPIGCLSGDRCSAISELVSKDIRERREQGIQQAQINLSQPKPVKRKRTRNKTKQVKPVTVDGSASSLERELASVYAQLAEQVPMVSSSQEGTTHGESSESAQIGTQSSEPSTNRGATFVDNAHSTSAPHAWADPALPSHDDFQSNQLLSMSGPDYFHQQADTDFSVPSQSHSHLHAQAGTGFSMPTQGGFDLQAQNDFFMPDLSVSNPQAEAGFSMPDQGVSVSQPGNDLPVSAHLDIETQINTYLDGLMRGDFNAQPGTGSAMPESDFNAQIDIEQFTLDEEDFSSIQQPVLMPDGSFAASHHNVQNNYAFDDLAPQQQFLPLQTTSTPATTIGAAVPRFASSPSVAQTQQAPTSSGPHLTASQTINPALLSFEPSSQPSMTNSNMASTGGPAMQSAGAIAAAQSNHSGFAYASQA